ncbi:MAG: hypothetical protein WDZ65_05425, partial [Aquisalimonadaceae bacterium]
WVYLAAILAGLGLGGWLPVLGAQLASLLWPLLALLLYVTFTQVPLARLPAAFRDGRFIAAVLIGNFLLIPLLVWGLIQFLPESPALRLGVLLVLLVPCTDWYITFTHLGRGDARRAIAVTPVNLLVQLMLLPVYLWLFMGEAEVAVIDHRPLVGALFGVVLLPLSLAFLSQRVVAKRPQRQAWLDWLGGWAVPLLAGVVFLIAASQVQVVAGALFELGRVLVVFAAFLLGAAVLGRVLSQLFRLPVPAGRALIFSLGTRNSFLVLPIALALPPAWEMAVVVIVLQSLVELFGMLVYLKWVPSKLLADVR